MLESIYGMKGGPSDALGRYLANVGAPKKQPGAQTQANPDGTFANVGAGMSPGDVLGKGAGPGGSYMVPGFSTNKDGSFMSPADIAAFGQQKPAVTMPQISTDYSADPVLQQIISGNIKDEGDAEASALGAQRNALGSYGDKNLAMAILGPNDPTIDSISDNPDTSTSTLARLHRGYNDSVKQTDNNDSAGNIFYGGAHIMNRSNLAKDEQTQEADANASIHAALNQIAQGLQTTKSNIASSRAQGESDAAARAAQAAILAALTGAGSTGATTPPGTDTPPPATDTAPPATTPPAGTGASADTGAVAPGAGLYYDPVNKKWINAASRNQQTGLGL